MRLRPGVLKWRKTPVHAGKCANRLRDRYVQFRFSNHVLDVGLRELTRGGESVAVEPQVFDLLIYLVENRERVVSKDDLIENIWDGRIVSESTLTSRINAARKAVGDSGRDQAVIRTIARKGFRFVGEVQVLHGGAEPRGDLSGSPGNLSHAPGEPPRASTPRARPHRHRRVAVHQSERRAGAGIFFRRHQRGHHHRAVEAALVLCDRPQLLVRLQGQIRPPQADRRRARRRLRRRRQRAQGRRPCAHHGPAQRCRHRQPHLGGALRSQPRRRFRRAGRNHPGRRRRDRAAIIRGRGFSRPAQGARQHGCLGSGDARAVALLARDAAGQSGGAGAARKGHRCRSRLRPGAQPAGGQPHLRRPYGLGGNAEGRPGRGTRGAGGDPRRQRGRVGALCARQRLSVQSPF